MNFEIRYANISDAYEIETVVANSWLDTYSGYMPSSYLTKRVNDIDNGYKRVENFLINTTTYLVAILEGKVVGVCYYCKHNDEKSPKYNGYGEIGALYLDKKYHGNNIGKALFKKGIEGLKELGCKKIVLECMQGNNAINFYKKYGGSIVETHDFVVNNRFENTQFSVKADVVVYESLEQTLNLLND